MKKLLLKGMGASHGVVSGEIKFFKGRCEDKKIVVVNRVTPDIIPMLKSASAVIAETGGITSHGVKILREFEVTCIVGAGHTESILKEGIAVTVDGWTGEVFEGFVELENENFNEVYNTRTKIYASIDVPKAAKNIADLFSGVGSLRSNYIIIESKKHPVKWIQEQKEKQLEDLIYEGTKQVLEAFRGKPVWYKTLDVPTDEFRKLEGGENEPIERNPLVGWRGIKRELTDKRLLDLELSVISRLKKEGYENLCIKIPFIRDEKEYKELKKILTGYGLENVSVGISVETPAVASSIDNFISMGVDFISIGINDLAMCFLGVGRDNERVSDLFRDDHPAILNAIENLVITCRESGVETCIAGRVSDNLLKFLVGRIDIICTEPSNVLEIRKKVYLLEHKKGHERYVEGLLHGKNKAKQKT